MLLLAFPLHLVRVAFLSQFANLHVVIFVIAKLPFVVFDIDAQGLYFHGEPLDFDGLKHNNKVELGGQILLAVIGEVLNAGS